MSQQDRSEPSEANTEMGAQPPVQACAATSATEQQVVVPPSKLRMVGGWLRRNAYLSLVVGAGLVLTKTIEFSPPKEVRVGKTDVGRIVGDAPTQEFAHELSNPQSVQVRATLRMYSDNELQVSAPDPDMDAQGKLLSQPVVTTILGMNATIEQTLRLEDGELEVDLVVNATPRLTHTAKRGKAPPPIVLESEVVVHSRRNTWWDSAPQRRTNLDSRAFLSKVEDHGHRLVFTVDDHLFSLDLEVSRAGVNPGPTLARGIKR